MAAKDPRLSHPTLRILGLFLETPRQQLAGTDICKRLDLLSGTSYPILMRLDRAGWIESEWEQVDPRKIGRPRKRLYRLTALGYNKSREALNGLRVPDGRPAWTW